MPRSQRLRPASLRPAPMAELLEPRLLFSADLAAALPLDMDTADAPVEQRTLDTNGEYAAETTAPGTAAAVATNYAATTLTFEVNEGQAAEGVDFIAYGGGYGISLQGGNASLTLLTDSGQRTVQLELAGDARSAEAEGQAQLQTRSNYVIGNDPSAWQTGIANYGAVVYRSVYEGIDVRYYGNQRQLEYDFIVAAGADPSAISLRFEGVSTASIAENGDLVLRVEGTDSDVRFRAPVSYQRGPDGLEEVASRYEIRADGSIGFVVENYDRSRELVIDPVLDYATYFGTTGSESAPAIAVDAAGNVYITGRTTSNNPPLGGVQGSGGGPGDIYVAKFSPDLSTLLFSTRIGGNGDEQGNAIAVDAAGNIAVTGWTQSGDFPMQSAADSSRSGAQDSVIFKLNASGSLVFSTYFGGNSTGDSGNAVAMDSAGNVYVAGQASDDGLLPLVLQLLFGSSDNAFINKYDANGGVVYQELFGGSSTDVATDIALGSTGDVYVVGNTQSSNWSATGGADGSLGGAIDGFLLHLDAAGNTSYSTYIGASNADTVTGVATDGSGKAYVVGVTRTGVSFPTTAGAFQTTTAVSNADTGFLRIYDTNQTGAASLVYSSYLGGSSSDRPTDVAYASGRVIVVGKAGSTDFPITADAVQSTHAGSPMYLAVITPAGAGAADLDYGTYYAGDMVNVGDIAISGNHAYVSGDISGSGWATTGAYQTANQGSDAFIAAFTLPNFAPVLNGVSQPAAIPEDSGAGAGFLISSLLAGQVTDLDTGALQGIAIIGFDSSSGSWEYTVDGSNWNAVTAPSVASALLLAADAQTRLRFVPAANFNGTVASGLTIRAWDRTSGTAGGRADTTTTGGTTAFSSAIGNVNITVTPVNDAPTSAPVTLPATSEDSAAITITPTQLLANAGDVDGDTLTVSGLAASSGSLIANADGTWSFTPAADFNGTVSFSYTISDGTAMTPGSASLLVTPVNDAPSTTPVALPAVSEDSPAITITPTQLLANAGDVDGDTLTVSGLAASSGSLTANADGTWSFTPAADFTGTVSFSYSVSDGTAAVAGSASLTVTPVNDAPTSAPVTLPAISEDSAAIIITPTQLLANAADVDGDTLTVSGLAASSGSLAANADGTWSFTPAADFNGMVSFSYRVSDGVATAAGSASLQVTAVNDAPTTAPLTLPPAAEDSAVIIPPTQLLANAGDVDGDTLTVSGLAASSGSLIANADGTWSFTPAADFNGTVSFSYSVSDGVAAVAGSASLTVTPINDAPTTAPVTLPAISEDSAAIIITPTQLLANAADVDGDALTITGLAASSGSLSANADGTWSFTPAADFNGTVSFSYSVSDGVAAVAGSASLQVTPVNDAPTTASVTLPAINEDSAITITPTQLLATAADVDGDALSVTGLAASSGSLTANADGTWSFTPAADFNGAVSFSYSVTDGTATIAGSASLTVTPVNDAPTNAPVTLPAISEDSAAITITPAQLLANASDVDGDALSISGLAASSGSLSANADGTWSFTPAADFNGTVSFSYSVSDGVAAVAGSASLTVTPVNDTPSTAPVAVTLPAINEDSAITITPTQLLANAADVDGDALSVTGLAASSGSLTANADGTWSFTPAADFAGTVSFSYSISDGTAAVAASASLQVTAVNDAPSTAPVALPTVSDEPEETVSIGGPATVSFTPLDPTPTTLPPDTAAPTIFAGPSGAGETVASGGSRTSGFILGAQGVATEPSDTAPTSVGSSVTGRLVLVADSGQSHRSVVFDPTGLQLISMRAEVELVLARFGIDSQSDDARLEEFQSAVRSAAFIGELDRLRESAREDLQLDKSVTISVASVSLGLSVIYILWLIRSGVLLGSYLSALPAWRFLDPLPVLSRMTDEEDDGEDDGEEEPLDFDRGSPRDDLRGFA
ncbi:cadherin-like domain-containing protein [Caenimonas soli]|uniref:cadherin-like domain-containing protein n=1 Tax=Caenimonas soli TaxID=2735555 RepID=UPI0015534732|nr:cadherin-like domain-containing protein [Caenimonas soli]NPC57317.1 cadherin-like domain-containing protein [Caenimonas soli]